jgi:hypothetical protein
MITNEIYDSSFLGNTVVNGGYSERVGPIPERRRAHDEKMRRKAVLRSYQYEAWTRLPPPGFVPASVNRHTGQTHEHRVEAQRRLGQP